MVTIRPVRLPEDCAQLLALDRSFTTDRVYRVVQTANAFALEETATRPPLRKDFPLADDLGSDPTWEQGFVAEHAGEVVGFAAVAYRRWNRRAELCHLYVAPQQRGQGIGRALIEAVEAAARDADARCLWLETSNLAYPAIAFYQRMGFAFCGLDVSLYDPAGAARGETALYFVRPLD